ncbi:trehalose-6-phosphate synthase [Candidatus Scalindua japonica]|uniref:Trehalose-6-phosphate synthase n=2 Tax=Candidatus Scalindua japonica TaxID=1284222 RepID=A0A286TWU1_9BACT|nr:trehalose-6-phosphate synthase [Candidatus Scalindua japonica]
MSHFYSLLPFSSIVAAYGVKQMLGFTGLGFVFFVVISLLLLIPALLQIFQYYLKYDALTFHIKTSQVINQKHTLNFIAEEGIAEYVKRNSAKDDFVLQWGYNHEFYVLAQRRASLRGHLASTLMTDPQLNDAMYINWKKDVLSDIEKLTPAFIVDFDGSLRIETVNKVSGHRYKLEKNVYGIYPLYRLVDTHTSRKRSTATEILKSLTENDTRRTINNKIFDSNSVYIKYVNNLVMKDRLKEADIYSEGGITEMFDDWRRINNQ